MAFSIPTAFRIYNKKAITTKDYSRKDADLIMQLFDKIVNGEFKIKCAYVYNTISDLNADTGEFGMLAYVVSDDKYYTWSANGWARLDKLIPTYSSIQEFEQKAQTREISEVLVDGEYRIVVKKSDGSVVQLG